MTLDHLLETENHLLTHTRRFTGLCERMGRWASGWRMSVSLLLSVMPQAQDGLEGDMLEFVHLLEEMQEAVGDLAREYMVLSTGIQEILENERKKFLSQ